MITKTKLDELVLKYETEKFINPDPIRFIHMYKNPKDIEIAGFLASLFAYGNRKIFIQKLNELFKKINNKPYEYVVDYNPDLLKDFSYRFSKDYDIICFFEKMVV